MVQRSRGLGEVWKEDETRRATRSLFVRPPRTDVAPSLAPFLRNSSELLRIYLASSGPDSSMGKNKSRELSQAEIWDDSALLQSWDDALAEYKVSQWNLTNLSTR